MKTDIYTKVVLSVIAFMFVMIGGHQYFAPAIAVKAEGQFAGLQFATLGAHYVFFDPRTGEVWDYNYASDYGPKGKLMGKARLTQLGQALVIEQVPK